MELLTSGTIVFLEPKVIDVFMVGGGGMGGYCAKTDGSSYHSANGGGGGGYTRTIKRIAAQGSYQITVGEGSTAPSTDGGTSAWGTIFVVPGGKSARNTATAPTSSGGAGWAGGSGSGGGVISNSDYGAGGSDGSDGEQGIYGVAVSGGVGQGFTTREFGEATGKLYAGGGGGGRAMMSNTPIISAGGSGGGGAGGFQWYDNSVYQAAGAGGANTGGGGGGAVGSYRKDMTGGSGGSGIVCFRDAQELPELAGTWVLNDRLYAPESSLYFSNQEFKIGDASNPNRGTGLNLHCTTSKISFTSYPSGYDITVYTFSSNSWGSDKLNYMTFPADATASDEFRAWLASNATKQTD